MNEFNGRQKTKKDESLTCMVQISLVISDGPRNFFHDVDTIPHRCADYSPIAARMYRSGNTFDFQPIIDYVCYYSRIFRNYQGDLRNSPKKFADMTGLYTKQYTRI